MGSKGWGDSVPVWIPGAGKYQLRGVKLWGDPGYGAKPLQILVTRANGNTYLSLYPGTVGGVYPKVEGQFLWAMPSDGNGGFFQYPRMEITLPSAGNTLQVWLKVRCVAGTVVEASVETGSGLPTNTIEYAYVLVGYIKPDGGVVQSTYGPLAYQLVFGLQSDQPFGHTFTFAP